MSLSKAEYSKLLRSLCFMIWELVVPPPSKKKPGTDLSSNWIERLFVPHESLSHTGKGSRVIVSSLVAVLNSSGQSWSQPCNKLCENVLPLGLVAPRQTPEHVHMKAGRQAAEAGFRARVGSVWLERDVWLVSENDKEKPGGGGYCFLEHSIVVLMLHVTFYWLLPISLSHGRWFPGHTYNLPSALITSFNSYVKSFTPRVDIDSN